MTRIARQITELIGHTPLLELSNYNRNKRLKARLIGNLEYFNPAGSVKDRVALAMIEDAERSGRLRPGATLIEPTSGNTGVGLALVSAVKGYTLILTMPETMSEERRKLLQAYGVRLVLTPGAEGMSGAIAKAEELRDSIPGAVIGAFIIGICENIIKGLDTLLVAYGVIPTGIGLSTFADAFTFVLLIIILVFKPTGLFGEKATDKV